MGIQGGTAMSTRKNRIVKKYNGEMAGSASQKMSEGVEVIKINEPLQGVPLRSVLELLTVLGFNLSHKKKLISLLNQLQIPLDHDLVKSYQMEVQKPLGDWKGFLPDHVFYQILGHVVDPQIRKLKSKIACCVKQVNYDALIYYVVRKDKKDYKTPLELNKISDEAEERSPFRSNLNFFFNYIDNENVLKIKNGERII